MHLFQVVDLEQPFQFAAEVLSILLAEPLNLKPPLRFHDPVSQQLLLRIVICEELIAPLSWNDPNGNHTDESSLAEGLPRLSPERVSEILRDQITRG